MTERYGLILFPETREAMTAEKEGKAHGLSVRIVPTPGKLVASCGFSLRYDLTGEDELYQFLQHLSVRTDGWYHASRQGLRTDYERWK
ncbi:DUF3343 domain-containing protein [uncultured Megasphaera sp.]|uniref:DUF3343 domain-containing protein n=1 Tax=uncultured Megasphaera sp. TaxID=165188 RepID=UPI003783F998